MNIDATTPELERMTQEAERLWAFPKFAALVLSAMCAASTFCAVTVLTTNDPNPPFLGPALAPAVIVAGPIVAVLLIAAVYYHQLNSFHKRISELKSLEREQKLTDLLIDLGGPAKASEPYDMEHDILGVADLFQDEEAQRAGRGDEQED